MIAVPVLSLSNEKYYVYELLAENYENGKLSISDKVVFKLMEVNETAYKVVLIEANKSSMLGRWFEVSVIEFLRNMTNGIVGTNMFDGLIRLPSPALYTFWIPPNMLEKAVRAVDMVNNERNKVCEFFEKMMSCRHECHEKYSSNNLSARRDCIINCDRLDPLRPLDYALTGGLSPAMYGLSGVVCNKIPELQIKGITARHDSNLYVFELEATRKPSSSITIKSVYSSSGWLLYFLSEETDLRKTPEGKQIEHTIIETVKLIDTNDETVKTAMETTKNIENPTNQLASIPLKPEIIAVLVGITVLASVIIFILKKH